MRQGNMGGYSYGMKGVDAYDCGLIREEKTKKMEWVSATISAVSLIVVALINKKTDKLREENEERAAQRETESRLSMEMMAASIELGDITAIAIQGGHLNGNIEAAREKAAKATAAYESWLRDVAAKTINN